MFVIRKFRNTVCFFLVLVFFNIHILVFAEEPLKGTLPTLDPRAVGMSGALRASPSGISGIYLNPAVLAMVPIYHFGGAYTYTGGDKIHSGAVAVADSITSNIAAGLSLDFSGMNVSHEEHKSWDGRLALAVGFEEIFHIGIEGRYLKVAQNTGGGTWGPSGAAALLSSGSHQVNELTFCAGIALEIADVLGIGLTGMNLTNTGSVFAPLELGTGISLNIKEKFLLEMDTLFDFTTHENTSAHLLGATEILLEKSVALRAGYGYDTYFKTNSISAGVSYLNASFSLDFGFLKELTSSGRTVLAFGFKYFVN